MNGMISVNTSALEGLSGRVQQLAENNGIQAHYDNRIRDVVQCGCGDTAQKTDKEGAILERSISAFDTLQASTRSFLDNTRNGFISLDSNLSRRRGRNTR